MAASDLTTALENVEVAIRTLSESLTKPESYTVEGLTVARAKLETLLANRKALLEQANAATPFEIVTRMVP